MFGRLLSILLIPLFVLGQVLPHSHADSGVAVPEDHANRPHVHICGGHSHQNGDHHHHGDGDVSLDDLASSVNGVVLSLLDPHDSDAVYLASTNTALGQTTVVQHADGVGVCLSIETAWPCVPIDSAENASPRRYGGLPIYLSVASLRL